ncbi:MAG: ATP-binding protein [Acidobacteriota bacterium]
MAKRAKKEPVRGDRARTDDSLKAERTATDLTMARRLKATQRTADVAKRKIRKDTDKKLSRDRKAADATRDQATKRVSPEVGAERRRAAKSLAGERRLADRGATRHRKRADSAVADERRARREMEKKVLGRERSQTDRDLTIERGRSDAAFRAAERRLARAKTGREKAAAAVSLRDEFLAILSHDLRSPLTVIAINAARVGRMVPEGEGSAQIRALCSQTEEWVKQIGSMVDDLLDAERMAIGHVELPKTVADLRDVARESVALIEPLLAAQEVSLHVVLPDAPVKAAFDRDRILQVLVNLLGNAVKFTPRGGKVWLGMETNDRLVRVTVADTGPGVPRADRKLIFRRFTQGALGKGGVGLGLYIAYRIVEAHGGKIGVESRSGTGSTFYFTLPKTKTKQSRGARRKKRIKPDGGKS